MTRVTQKNRWPGWRSEAPRRLRAVVADPRSAWLWLVVRIGLGWYWLETGWRGTQDAGAAAQPIAVVQTLVGIALILGLFTGAAALVGGCLAIVTAVTWGPRSLVLVAAAVSLVLAWKNAGSIGLDRWLLPLVGMTWRDNALFGASARHDKPGFDRGTALRTDRNGSVTMVGRER